MKEFKSFPAHRDDEGIDKIEMQIVPRYKESELSGDEWRVSCHVSFYRKGNLIMETSFNKMESAILGLGHLWNTRPEWSPIALWGFDGTECHQPSCAEPATHVFQMKERFSAQGDGPLPQGSFSSFVAYCDKHKTRGDCGREDADRNLVAAPK